MKPDQLEIARLRREVPKLKAERDILKKSRGLLREGVAVKFAFIAKHRGIWPAGVVVRGARCLAGGLLCLADSSAQSSRSPDERCGARVRASFLTSDRTYGGSTCLARPARGGNRLRPSSDRAADAATALRARPRRRRVPAETAVHSTNALAAECAQPVL